MRNKCHILLATIALTLVVVAGCCTKRDCVDLCSDNACYLPPTDPGYGPQQISPSDPCLDSACLGNGPESFSPYDINESTFSSDKLMPLTLEQCIQSALASSSVMRDLGVTVIRSPQSVTSRMDPSMVFSDPRAGEEAALSAFDANVFATTSYENNDRRLNNQFFGNQGFLNQDLSTTQIGINKRSATGGLFSFRNVTVYDKNNQLSNTFIPKSWETYVEGEVRQPLMQNAGAFYNRIAGPGAQPGQLNGVLLARIRTDVSLTDFERSVRDLVAEVENAYWDLYYAYRDLEAKVQVRDIAKHTFDTRTERKEGAEKLAQAREQVYRFESEILDAMNGRPTDGTRTNNGSSGGTFRGVGGIRVSERKLRLMIGFPINDGRLIQPVDSPAIAPVTFDWQTAINEALQTREELRRQRWIIKQKELELAGNRNFLKPQLDLISRYRVRGFDQDLTGSTGAIDNFFQGNLQEWQLGMEYNLPIGLRRAHAAVRNSQLSVAREAEILREQERVVHLGLSNAINDASRSYENMQLQEKRLVAIKEQLDGQKELNKNQNAVDLDVELDTHRRLLDARLRFHQAQVEYQLALRNVHFEKGTLLAYNNVSLNESVASTAGYTGASALDSIRDSDFIPQARDPVIAQPKPIDYSESGQFGDITN